MLDTWGGWVGYLYLPVLSARAKDGESSTPLAVSRAATCPTRRARRSGAASLDSAAMRVLAGGGVVEGRGGENAWTTATAATPSRRSSNRGMVGCVCVCVDGVAVVVVVVVVKGAGINHNIVLAISAPVQAG